MTAVIYQFRPRANHAHNTDFPPVTFTIPEQQRALILGEPHEREIHAAYVAPDQDPA